jgi:hypothetical protein
MNQNPASLDSSPALPAVLGSGLLGDEDRRRAFRNAIAEVSRYRSLPAGWDGEGGLPACPKAADFSRGLLELLQSAAPGIGVPFVSPISTGVFLQWQSGDATLYFEVDEDSVLWMMQKGNVILASDEDPRFDVDQAYDLVARFHRIDTVPVDGIARGAV